MKEIINKVKLASVRSLTRMVRTALQSATVRIEAQTMQFARTQLPPIREESDAIAERFMINLNEYFDEIVSLKQKETDVSDYGNLSIVDNDYLEAIIAMEGMVNHARNCDIQQYISFTTRLDTLFPKLHIDETNNPLDPEQLGDCFNNAIKPLGLKAHYLLTIYREFNKEVFHNLEQVLSQANEIMIDGGIMAKLDIKARNKQSQKTKRVASRPTTDRETRAFGEPSPATETDKTNEKPAVEMFAMMQTLIKGLAEKDNEADAGDQLVADQHALKEQQSKLLEILSSVQDSLNTASNSSAGEPASNTSTVISDSISESLQASSGELDAELISTHSSDVINLVTLLFEAIWKDDSLPLAMKELIGRIQIPIMKIALTDTSFFDDEKHPGRVILNEFSIAGISWTEESMLDSDPVYSKTKELVELLIKKKEVDNSFIEELIDQLRTFKSKHGQSNASLEQRIREADEHSDRLDDVNAFVTQKINERILTDNLDPSIRNLLSTHFHDFLVKLVLKEGPGGSSWKPVMSTIDVLLWTVKKEKNPDDKQKFDKINPRLLNNVEKALEIGGASKSKSKKIMRQLRQVQDYSFHIAEVATTVSAKVGYSPSTPQTDTGQGSKKRKEPPPLPRNDPHLRQVENFPIGIWLEFKGAAGQPVRCTLAAKIDSIDKMFFVNRQGVKVVELGRMRLARELKAGSVKIVSEGSLVNRAMESVISDLRKTKVKE